MGFDNLEQAVLPVKYTIDPDFSSDRFVKMRLAICHDGANLNGTLFTVAEFEDAAPSLPYSPILAYVEFDEHGEPQFTGHERHIEFDDNGMRTVYDETPIGVIPENCNYAIEEIDGKNFVCADAYVWREYSNYALDIIERDSYVPLSMEISIEDYEFHKATNLYKVLKFSYTGVTFCSDPKNVAMQGAYAVPVGEYSVASTKFFTMLKEALREELTITREGGTSLETTETSVTEQIEETVSEDNTAEPEAPSAEETVETTEEPADSAPSDETAEQYQLCSNIVSSIYESLRSVTFDWDGYACQKYFYMDMDVDSKRVYVMDMEDGRIYGVDYTMDGDKLSLGSEYKRQVMEYRDYVDGDPEREAASVFTMAQGKLDSYQAEIASLTARIEEYETAAKQAALEKKASEIEALFSQFEDLSGLEEFETVKKAAIDDPAGSDLSALELQCYAIRGKQITTNYTTEQSKEGKLVLPRPAGEENKFLSGSRAVLEHFIQKKG